MSCSTFGVNWFRSKYPMRVSNCGLYWAVSDLRSLPDRLNLRRLGPLRSGNVLLDLRCQLVQIEIPDACQQLRFVLGCCNGGVFLPGSEGGLQVANRGFLLLRLAGTLE